MCLPPEARTVQALLGKMEMLRSQRAAARQQRLLVHELELRSSPTRKTGQPQATPTHAKPWGANTKAKVKVMAHAGPTLPLPMCTTCNKPVNAERYTVAGKTYHRACFECHQCATPLKASAAKVCPYFEHGGHVFCSSCFRALHGNPCSVCARRNLTWKTLGGWTYCVEHEREKFNVCFACSRLVLERSLSMGQQRAPPLPDGRVACKRCAAAPVTDVATARALFLRVHEFFTTILKLRMPSASDIHIELVDRWDAMGGTTPTDLGHGVCTRRCCLGLTRTEQLEDKATGEVLPSSLTVRSISLLSHLPEDLALSTLAHEAGHVFLHMNGYHAAAPAMSDRVSEGLCELFAYMWEHQCANTGVADEGERANRMRVMETSQDAVYGVGFRDALAAFASCKFDLGSLLAHVRDAGGELPRAGTPHAEVWAKKGGRAWQGCGGAYSSREQDDPAGRLDTWRRRRAYASGLGRRPATNQRAVCAAASTLGDTPHLAAPAPAGENMSVLDEDAACQPCDDDDAMDVCRDEVEC